MVSVSVASGADSELVAAVRRLVPQLSTSAVLPGAGEVREIVASPATLLLVARDEALGAVEGEAAPAPGEGEGTGGPIVGMLTLVLFRLPTGLRAWIEDVVVDTAARGRGVGEALTHAAVGLARARGAATVDLTSRPSREAANRLYQKLGFECRQTNVYRRYLRNPGQ
ncbi:MAG: GNAT family N-acetyltransferase [Actinomycetota bacterium]|nr:GNAT family N-acetyltransferase [Actinomycetota bacterium]